MPDASDNELLDEFARTGGEAVFAAIVERHLDLVYGVAMRHTSNPADASDIAQAVFIVLARKAKSLRPGAILAGWLYHTARLTARNFKRSEARRARREQEVYLRSLEIESDAVKAGREMEPFLEEAMAALGAVDRDAVVLRYFANKTLKEVGAALGMEERAAQKRVGRAVEKLRRAYGRRGLALTATVIAAGLSANAVRAAPAGLASTVTAAGAGTAAAGAGVGGAVSGLAAGTLASLAWLNLRLPVTVGGLAVATVAVISVAPSSSFEAKSDAAETVALVAAPAPPPAREPLADNTVMFMGTPPGGVVLQPDGKIVLGTTLSGFFVDESTGSLGHYSRGVVRLLPDGGLDRSFHNRLERQEGMSPMIANVALHPDGRLLVAGSFASMEGKPRPRLAMLLSDGRLDESFEPWRGQTNQIPAERGLNGIHHATVLRDGSVAKIALGIEGPFAKNTPRVNRFDASGRLLPLVKTNFTKADYVLPSGLVQNLDNAGFYARKLIDWSRDTVTETGTFAPGWLKRPPGTLVFDRLVGPPTAADGARVFQALFEEVPIEFFRYAARLPDGGVIFAIREEYVPGNLKAKGRLMRFDRDWRRDPSFVAEYETDLAGHISIKLQPDGKLYVTGIVGELNGEPFPGMLRLRWTPISGHPEAKISYGGGVWEMCISLV